MFLSLVRRGSPLSEVANQEKMMPENFISENGFEITDACRTYLQPLIEGKTTPYRNGIPQYQRLQNRLVPKKLLSPTWVTHSCMSPFLTACNGPVTPPGSCNLLHKGNARSQTLHSLAIPLLFSNGYSALTGLFLNWI